METPQSTSNRFSFSKRFLKNVGLLLMVCGGLLLLHLILSSPDSEIIFVALLLLGIGDTIYRKLSRPLQVVVHPIIFVFDPATKETELPRDEPRH